MLDAVDSNKGAATNLLLVTGAFVYSRRTGAAMRDDPPIRVLIAHQYPLLRQGIRVTIAAETGMEVVGEAATGTDILEQATASNPDVVICDADLPGLNGLEVARQLRLHLPNVRLMLVVPQEDEEYLFEAVKAGASAYILGTASPEYLVSTLRRVARGEHLIDDELPNRPLMASRVLHKFTTIGDDTPQEIQPLFAPLSPREIEILEQICRGNSNKQIARILAISEQTVKNHITSIFKKLAVNDRTEAVVFSLRRGWINLEATAS